MDGTDGRLSLPVLAAGAVLALTAGVAWWVSAAPDAAAPEPPRPEPIAPAVVAPPELAGPESYLPELPNTVGRHVGVLNGQFHLIVEAEADGDYLLQHVCFGPGSLQIRIRLTDQGTELYDADCGGSFGTIRFTAAEHDLVVDLSRSDAEPAEVGVQVIALS